MRFASLLPCRCFLSTSRINASWRAAAFGFSPRRDRLLVAAFRSPATMAAFAVTIPASMFPACYFAGWLGCSQARSAFGSATGSGWPRFRPLLRFCPLPARFLARAVPLPASTPLQDFYSLGIEAFCRIRAARSAFPVAPGSFRSPLPSLLLVWEPDQHSGSLRFRRLAVPQTSWNLSHYALTDLFRQRLLRAEGPVFIRFYFISVQ